MRRRCRVSPWSMRRWPSHPGDQHHTLRPTDRGDPQFRSAHVGTTLEHLGEKIGNFVNPKRRLNKDL